MFTIPDTGMSMKQILIWYQSELNIFVTLSDSLIRNEQTNIKKGDIRIGMRTQNQPRSNWISGIEVEILKEADLAGISNVSCSPVVAGGNKVRPSVHWVKKRE